MISNENNSRVMSLSRFTVEKNNDTKESHLLNFLCLEMPSYEMLPVILMGADILLFDNSVLEIYLLYSQLNFYMTSLTFGYFIILYSTVYILYIRMILYLSL